VEREEVVIAKQWNGKDVSAATDVDATVKDAVFSMRSMPRLYNKDHMRE
jgi:hypothetical protein